MFRKRNRSFLIGSWCQISANGGRFFGATLHARLRAFLWPNICQFSERPFKQQNRKPSPRALSLFVDGVAKVIACNRIDHGGHQLTGL
jgi:hypothetical protein